jgi:patatin-like phospholipase
LTRAASFPKVMEFMLEICLPVSGLSSISLIGALTALRERKVVPDIFTGVSGGAWAAMAVLGKCYRDGHAVHFVKKVRDHLISKPIRRFLPPYPKNGIPTKLLNYGLKHSSGPRYIRSLGVKHFYVGYTQFPSFRFTIEDVLECPDRKAVFQTIWKSSSLPFVTHHGLHSHRGLDGGFRKLVFPSEHRVKERWILSNYVRPLKYLIDPKKFHRIIQIRSRIPVPFIATDRQIHASFEVGYEEGMGLSV